MHPVGSDSKNCLRQDIVSSFFVCTGMCKKISELPGRVYPLCVCFHLVSFLFL